VDDVAWSPDSRRFAVAAGKSTTIFAARSGRRVSRAADHADELNTVAFSPSGRLVVTAGTDAVAKVSDVETGALIAELHGHKDWVLAAAFLPSGRDIVTVSADGTARRWRLPTGRILRGHHDWVLDAEFTDDGHVLTAGENGGVRLWNLLTGRSVRMSGHTLLPTTSVTSLAVTPDGTHFVTAGDDTSNTGQVLVGDAHTGKIVDEIVPDAAVLDVALSPDGTRVLTTSRWGPAVVRDLYGKHKTRATLPLGLWQWAIRASYSPDGRRIATAGYDGAARIFDAHTFKPVKVLRRRGALYGAIFSRDSRRLLTFGADATAQLWDLRGRVRAPIVLAGHTGIVDAGAFSPDGTRVVTGSVDHTTRVWDASSGQLLSTQRMHSDIVNSVAFSPDGTTILSASDDHTARLYPCQTCASDAALLRLARRRVFRGLTPAEKAEYGDSLATAQAG
jgi:WD40 repeat protein